jgi:hypothetical protein
VDFDVLKRVITALENRGVIYAIFGAAAMGLHGFVRATEDLDLFVAPEASNIERLRLALTDVFADPAIEEITAADLLGAYPSIRYCATRRDVLSRPPDSTGRSIQLC